MIIDAFNLFSNAQAVTTTATSANSIDLGLAARDIGAGKNLYVVTALTVAMTGTNPNSTVVALATDDNAAFTSGTALQTLYTFPTNSAAGTTLVARIQPSASFERYLAVTYTPANTLTTGSFTSFIASDADVQRYYANGFTIAAS